MPCQDFICPVVEPMPVAVHNDCHLLYTMQSISYNALYLNSISQIQEQMKLEDPPLLPSPQEELVQGCVIDTGLVWNISLDSSFVRA